MSDYFVSINKLLKSVWPAGALELPGDAALGQIQVRPAEIRYDPVMGMLFETELLLGQGLELGIPQLPLIRLFLAGAEGPIAVRGSAFPDPGARVGPLTTGVRIQTEFLVPVKKIRDNGTVMGFAEEENDGYVSVELFESTIGYSLQKGLQLYNRFAISLPLVKVRGTDLIIGLEEATFIFNDAQVDPAVYALGFDQQFRGVYARSVDLYWLPEIRLNGFDIPGLRMEFDDLAIGNQGVSFDLQLSWDVVFDDAGHFMEADTELLGYLLFDDWAIAVESASGTVRANIPEAFSVKTYLRAPFFEAIFSAYFGLSYQYETAGDSSFKTFIHIAKESADPIVVGYPQLQLTVNNFSAEGLLTDQGFSISGNAAFAIDIYGFAISVSAAALAYSHLDGRDEFSFVLTDVVLGELGTAEQAELIIKGGKDAAGDYHFEEIKILAAYRWEELTGLIPEEIRDQVDLPPDGRIEASIFWEEQESEASSETKLVAELKAEVSHLDQLWQFIPEDFRPQVRKVNSVFRIRYDSVEAFTASVREEDKVQVELTAYMEVKLPDIAGLAIPGFDLLAIHAGDEEGFITAEYRANFSSSASGDHFNAGVTIQHPFSIDIRLPGAAAEQPFIHTAIQRIGFQFQAGENEGEEMELGGRLLFEGDFNFRPLVPGNYPFAAHFNALMRQVGLDDIRGRSTLTLDFTGDSFDLEIAGEFEQFGIQIDVFEMLSALAPATGSPGGKEIEVDFDIGFHLIGFKVKIGTESGGDPGDDFYFSFELTVACTLTGLPPVRASIRLSDDEFALGLKDLVIPLEIPRYPLSVDDFNQLSNPGGLWTQERRTAYSATLSQEIDGLAAAIQAEEIPALQFELIKDKAHLELKKLLLELVMAIHTRVSPSGQPVYQQLILADTWIHETALGILHVDTSLKLFFPEIGLKIPFDDPSGISLSGSGKIIGFGAEDPFKALENYTFSLGLSSQYIFAKIESGGEPLPIPSFGTKYDDGSISISQFAIGYGYSKNSFMVDFAGELILPTELIRDADTSQRIGAGIRLPRYNKLAFKLDFTVLTIGKATIVIPLPQFDLDLRSPNAPPLLGTTVHTPYWDGLQLIVPNLFHAGLKRLAFSPFFGFAILPNIKFDGDLQIGDRNNGLTLILDDLLVLIGLYVPALYIIPTPFIADPLQPYFQNISANLRLAGFEINFNLQRPFPSASPLAMFEALGLISDPMMAIDPQGALANTIRFTLSNAYVKVPDFVVQCFPAAAGLVDRQYGFTLNLGTLIRMVQAVAGVAQPVLEGIKEISQEGSHQLESVLNSLPNTFDPWALAALLPPELRKFRLGGRLAGFEASACLVIATAEEAAASLRAGNGAGNPPELEFEEGGTTYYRYSRSPSPALTPFSDADFENHWTKEGVSAGAWAGSGEAVRQTETLNGISYFLYGKTDLPEQVSLSFTLHTPETGKWGGIVFDYENENDYYLLRTTIDAQGQRQVVLEEKRSGGKLTLIEKAVPGYPGKTVSLALITYTGAGARFFIVHHLVDVFRGNGGALRNRSRVFPLGEAMAPSPLSRGRIGLYAKYGKDVEFRDLKLEELEVRPERDNVIRESALSGAGFGVNAGHSVLDGRRLIRQDESAALFKGTEFQRFDAQDLDLIPVEELGHGERRYGSVYLGAFVRIAGRQRFRFLGQLFENGSFALVSALEVQPLSLKVFGIPFALPFEGYGRLRLVGGQRRSGAWGYVRAEGYFDWSPIPNVLRLEAGATGDPASLTLHSDGRFAIDAAGRATLFGGAGIVEGSVFISQEKAAFAGRLRYSLGQGVANYPFGKIVELDIEGSGLVEAVNRSAAQTENNIAGRYSFTGRGGVTFLGETFSNIEVEVNERYASFECTFRKPPDAGASGLEDRYPVLKACDLMLDARGRVSLRRTLRPEFDFSGEGYLKILGAEIRGRGGIRAAPSHSGSLKDDFFEAFLEGDLRWQGRKWLGGRISVGSKGLLIAGSTQIGLNITPAQIPGTQVHIASLFLDIRLEGEFRLDAGRQKAHFLFRGAWTLGAALPNTGNAGNRQLLPLAASEFSFDSNFGTNLPLFDIDGFRFLPLETYSIPVPVISLSKASGAKTMVKAGDLKDVENGYAVEFWTPGGRVGLKSVAPFAYVGSESMENTKKIYSAYKVNVDWTSVQIDFTEWSNLKLSLSMQEEDGLFPLKLILTSGDEEPKEVVL